MNDALAFKKSLAEKIQRSRRQLWDWHLEHTRQCPPPFYCSVDIRDSGNKIVPVDSNLYPAGFNNICPDDIRSASPVVRAHLDAFTTRNGIPDARKILVLPETHTSNLYYIENLYYLCRTLADAGLDVRLGWYGPIPGDDPSKIRLCSATGKELTAYSMSFADGVVSAGDFVPDLILLNNDFSSGYPEPLDRVRQPILPSHLLGWHTRKKSEHFRHYNRLAGEFAEITGIDPWSIRIDTEEVTPVNFNENRGIEQTAVVVEKMLARIGDAYGKRKIDQKPFVFIKNNHGTYGMGIMVAHSADEVRNMNRRTKNKMSVGKGRTHIESIAVQEGVPTTTLVDRLAAEPVIYLIGAELIGGFLRTNKDRGIEDNLNSPGMVFKKLCMSDLHRAGIDPRLEDEEPEDENQTPLLELVYGSVARISALATGLELSERQHS